jgi:hypothetical protein
MKYFLLLLLTINTAFASQQFPFSFWGTFGAVSPTGTIVLHLDGSNGGTTFTQSGASSTTFSVGGGSPVTTTSNFKFGTASLNTASSSYIDGTANADYAFGTGDFTIGFWVYRSSWAGTGNSFFELDSGGATGYMFDYNGNTGNARWSRDNSDFFCAGALGSALNDAAWNYIEINRCSGVVKFYGNGTNNMGSCADTQNYSASGSTFHVGYAVATANGFGGLIDDFFIIKGSCLHNANFTNPTAPVNPP